MSAADDPILLAAERRRRERAAAQGIPADAAPVRSHQAGGPDVSTPSSDVPRPEPQVVPEADSEALPHITPGSYEIAFQGAEKVRFWGRERWVLRFVVVEPGAANGVVLLMFVNAPPAGAKPRRGWALSTLYVAATGRPPPRNLARLHPRSFLANAVFVGRVVDVGKDQFGAKVAEPARYSKIANLIGPAAGRPVSGRLPTP